MKFRHLKGALERNLATFVHQHLTCAPLAHPFDEEVGFVGYINCVYYFALYVNVSSPPTPRFKHMYLYIRYLFMR